MPKYLLRRFAEMLITLFLIAAVRFPFRSGSVEIR